MSKRLKLMVDYECFPLWDLDEPANLDPTTLPLPPNLCDELVAWARCYDLTLDRANPAASGFRSTGEAESFESQGLRLWAELRQALGPTYEVYYFSEVRRVLVKPT